jgi:hypothetical protein
MEIWEEFFVVVANSIHFGRRVKATSSAPKDFLQNSLKGHSEVEGEYCVDDRV